MQKVPLGRTGLEVSRLCLGSMQFGWTADEAASFAVMDAFAEAGGNFIDTADIYSNWAAGNQGGDSELIIGRWMKERGNRGGMVVATKLRGRMWDGPDGDGLGRGHIIRACEDSLRRLQVETIDLYQTHWFDENVPIEETLRAFEELVKAGKIRHIGASNYRPHLLKDALNVAAANNLPGYATLQPHHSLVHRREYEEELAGICTEYGLGVIPYSPLAGGFLTGKYAKGGERVQSPRAGGVRQYFTDEGWAALEAVKTVAQAHSTTPSAVALAWQMTVPGITSPIVGANSPAQLADQLPALTLELTAADREVLLAASRPFLDEGSLHEGS
ncbi:MAG: aldo/keto reductase [bacterium]